LKKLNHAPKRQLSWNLEQSMEAEEPSRNRVCRTGPQGYIGRQNRFLVSVKSLKNWAQLFFVLSEEERGKIVVIIGFTNLSKCEE
jgi:hypothetical protein